MNKLQVLGREGHKELVWDPAEVEAGDLNAAEVIAEAERILDDAVARGHLALRIDSPDQPAVRIEKFDATAPRTVIVPRIVGG
ncbi:MAG: hypothetical protein R3E79_57380 [Caldilineaceae bacterium]